MLQQIHQEDFLNTVFVLVKINGCGILPYVSLSIDHPVTGTVKDDCFLNDS